MTSKQRKHKQNCEDMEERGLRKVVKLEIKLPALTHSTKDFALWLIGNEEPLY